MHDPNPIRARRPRPTVLRRRAHAALWALVLVVVTACSGEAPLPGDPLRLLSTSLPDPILNEPYQHDLTPSGGLRPYTFTLEEGRLPPGIALQGGTLIGTPTELGRFEFTVSVSDANLSSGYESFAVTVRDLPVPALDLVVPDTEIRGDTQLRVGVRDARRLRGVRVWIDWQHEAVRVGPGLVRASRDDVVVFASPRDGGVAIDAAVLGEPLDGDVELFRLDLVADEAVVLGLDVRSEFLYADRHAYAETRVGTPRRDPPPAEGEGDGADPADEPLDDDGADDGPDTEDPGGEAPEAEGDEGDDATPPSGEEAP